MRSTLSPAFTSSKMKNMFVLVSECGVQLGDFLHKCINDKTMKTEHCKIERGKCFLYKISQMNIMISHKTKF